MTPPPSSQNPPPPGESSGAGQADGGRDVPSYPQSPPSYQQDMPPYPQGAPSYPQGPPSYSQGAPSYPQGMPSYPQGPGDAQPPIEPPPSIVRAVLLMRVGAGLSLLGMIVSLATLSSTKDKIRDTLVSRGDLTQANLDNAYRVAVVSAIVGGILGVALWLWMAHANGRGRKWARIVSTVLGVISIVSVLSSVALGQSTAIAYVFGIVTAVLAVVILVFLWNRESSAYYNARSRAQRY